MATFAESNSLSLAVTADPGARRIATSPRAGEPRVAFEPRAPRGPNQDSDADR